MKLTVVVLFGLIGVAIALHGTGAYGNAGGYGNGGYGNNGGGGHKHHKSSESESSSSESEEFIPPRPKTCKLNCVNNATVEYFEFGVKSTSPIECDDYKTDLELCNICCQHWVLSRGLTTVSFK
uniref:Uncharacterized protein n=1 Tax=Panagrolaimus davidi TaxID=227884 RepID=A0A914QRH1_9BILA